MRAGAGEATAHRATKGWRRGTHRTVAPEVTLRRLEPLLTDMGITRVGMLTGLDRVGLPVATAVRPNGRALAVSLGKGLTPAAAKVSAIMEAAESYHAERVTGPLHWAAFDELPAAVDPARLPQVLVVPDNVAPRAARCLWIGGQDLIGGADVHVPYQLVHADYTVGQAEPARFEATTNGLAAGNEMVEAKLHGLYEAVERDAISCWRAAGGPNCMQARPFAPQDVPDADISELVARIREADAEVAAWDVTSDIGVPAFVALIVPGGDERAAVEPEIGSGCHLDPVIALGRAVTEAAQTRLARISGARDDFEPASYDAEARLRRRVEANGWLARAHRSTYSWDGILAGFARAVTADLDSDLQVVLAALAEAGLDTAVWVDLSRSEIGLPVGRIVVPGLEGPWLPGRYRPGERARRQ